jgi:hypothetical protein
MTIESTRLTGASEFLPGAEQPPLCGPRRPWQDGQKLPVRAAIQPDQTLLNAFFTLIDFD